MISVDVKNLTVKFDEFTAVNNITFDVQAGEIFGFLGANGAGKTTTIRVLCGLILPTEGNVEVAGCEIPRDLYELKTKVGYMSQRFTLYNDLTVDENLNFIAALRKIPKEIYLKRRKELLDFIQFDRPVNTLVSDLPGGTKHQVSLVASMLHDPQIIFLDEPTAGVSPVSRALFWDLIKQLSKAGKTMFVTTHFLDEAEHCNRIALMREGKIVSLNTPENLKHTAFEQTMYEFEPKNRITYQEMIGLQKSQLFSYFEPYGNRFHVVFNAQNNYLQDTEQFKNKFYIKKIMPSIEDVFIKTIEGH
jgi:ABC-2 type transport system ATP-binding protein